MNDITNELRLSRLNDLLSANEACPDGDFDIGVWGYRTACGTSHCLAGNYAKMFPDRLELAWSQDGYGHESAAIINPENGLSLGRDEAVAFLERHFGLDYEEVLGLFFSSSRYTRKRDALKALRRLIETYSSPAVVA